MKREAVGGAGEMYWQIQVSFERYAVTKLFSEDYSVLWLF